MRMESTHYLPSEVIRISNYPELQFVQRDIERVQLFAEKVQVALELYNTGDADRIAVDVDELKSYIFLCRTICETIGTTEKVCFDVLMELRSYMEVFHDILFAYNRYGGEYVGTPTPIDEDVMI